MERLEGHFQQFVCDAEPAPKRGRPRANPERVTTSIERSKKSKDKKSASRREHIAVLDFETEPFDNKTQRRVYPFTACLYSDHFAPVILWESHFPTFVEKLMKIIIDLPGEYTIYAHNGGRFDFMYLISKMRGQISFKGRSIMAAKIGNHHLRDSFHLIPEKLAAYQKEVFDYSKNMADRREAHKDEIIRYMVSDCVYLLDLVKKFVGDFGLKLSIGQAAMCELKKIYPDTGKFTDGWDALIREYFFGGRVECIRGKGTFDGDYKLIDLNSAYPAAMAFKRHPVGAPETYHYRAGPPSNDTVFIDLTCRNNGALVGRTDEGETSARIPYGRFKTTIWEYETALKCGLISDVQVHYSLDCPVRTDFSQFILPLYEKRIALKQFMDDLKKQGQQLSQAFIEAKKDDMFYKFLLNNSYGKWAQNPRRFKEHYITDPGELPPASWFKSTVKNKKQLTQQLASADESAHAAIIMGQVPSEFALPSFESDQYHIWSKPCPAFTFNNVGTAASITGAVRATLLEAIHNSIDPIYCDTDSIICKGWRGLHMDKTALGAWDLEDEFTSVVIAGKKLYAPVYKSAKPRTPQQLQDGMSPDWIVKSKGASGITLAELVSIVNVDGASIEKTNKGPTLDRFGNQYYLTRKIRATAQKEVTP